MKDQFICRYCETSLADRHDVEPGDQLTCENCRAEYEIYNDHDEQGTPSVSIDCKHCAESHTVEFGPDAEDFGDGKGVAPMVTCPHCDTDHSYRDDEVTTDPEKGHPKFRESIRLLARPRSEL